MQKELLISLLITALISTGAYNLLSQKETQINLRSHGILQEFENWKIEYNINFKSIEEEIFRRKVFEDSVKLVNKVNSQQQNYTLKINQFAHITDEEFAQFFLNKKEDPIQQDQQYLETQILQNENQPNNFTWKGKGVLTPVQNQGYCDASYVFSSIGMAEAYYVLDNKQPLTKLSEQWLLSCNTIAGGCQGGSVQQNIDYMQSNSPPTAYHYPYVSQNGDIPPCNTNIDGVPDFNLYVYNLFNPPLGQGRQQFVHAIKNGPIGSAIDGSNLRLYNGGIWSNCGIKRNLDILVTGYNEKYWEMKTPFGPSWGENGYLRIQMGDTCGITTEFYLLGLNYK